MLVYSELNSTCWMDRNVKKKCKWDAWHCWKRVGSIVGPLIQSIGRTGFEYDLGDTYRTSLKSETASRGSALYLRSMSLRGQGGECSPGQGWTKISSSGQLEWYFIFVTVIVVFHKVKFLKTAYSLSLLWEGFQSNKQKSSWKALKGLKGLVC